MSMLDPFNPRPWSPPGQDQHEQQARRRGVEPQDGGKSFLWVPVAILGGIGALVVVAAL